jgi:glycine hydroxymethyltransferase
MSSILDAAVFPGTQGGPLEHVIGAKAIAFAEAMTDDFKAWGLQVKKNAACMARCFVERGYKVISGGTDNHLMLIDLRPKGEDITGKLAENALVKCDITVNKNTVPFETRSPFVTSGFRVGTSAITTRGLKEEHMDLIVSLIDKAILNHANEGILAGIRLQVHELMRGFPIYADSVPLPQGV